jgi:PAS domain S-box-containing protein
MRTHVATKIAFGLAFLIMGIVFLAGSLNLIPDDTAAINKNRTALCELFSVQCASAIARDDIGAINDITTAIHERNPDLRSVGVRAADGHLVAQAGSHQNLWGNGQPDASMIRVHVPLFLQTHQWGAVEFCFAPPSGSAVWAPLFDSQVRLIFFVSSISLLGFTILRRRVLQQLGPTSVIPDRVKALLDTLAEGVVVLDDRDRMVVVNSAFTRAVGLSAESLLGRSIHRLPWQSPAGDQAPTEFPWKTASRNTTTQRGIPLMLESKTTGRRTFSVSASPICGENQRLRGVFISFEVQPPAPAIGARDIESLSVTAHHLGQFAAKEDLPNIAELALRLQQAAEMDHDLSKVLQTTTELLQLCHSAQQTMIAAPAKQVS